MTPSNQLVGQPVLNPNAPAPPVLPRNRGGVDVSKTGGVIGPSGPVNAAELERKKRYRQWHARNQAAKGGQAVPDPRAAGQKAAMRKMAPPAPPPPVAAPPQPSVFQGRSGQGRNEGRAY